MPIYAYRCEACGFAKDVLQKMSDPQLTVCLSCGAPSFKKQLTAAGFQLKGTGWYATDFRNGSGTSAPAVAGTSNESTSNESASQSKPAGTDKSAEKGGDKGAGKNGDSKAAPAAGSASSPVAAPAAKSGSTPSSAT